jgi:hypothetical protein
VTVNSVSYVRGIIPDKQARERDDFHPTPPEATRALLTVEKFHGAIWEPACGDGAISKVLRGYDYKVESTDLIYRGYGAGHTDFLLEWEPRAPNIVTNPPFKLATEFIENALKLTTGKVAMLGRLAWLEGVDRHERVFKSQPLARVHVFSKRIAILRNGEAMESGGGGMIAFAWFVWEHGYTGKPTLGWL